MANLEIEGRIAQKLNVQSGKSARGEWSKQEFVLEFQDGNFSSNAVFSVWGADKVRDLEVYAIGSQVKVSFGISSREYNGRWYTDLRAWRIQAAGQGTGASAPAVQSYRESGGQDLPAGFAPSGNFQSAPAPTMDDMPSEPLNGDDLPF